MIATALLIASTAFAALQQAFDASADWKMDRRLAGSKRIFTTSGTVSCKAGEGIVWTVLRPFESTITMGKEEMSFEDEDGKRVKPLSELPHYAALREATDKFVAGDSHAFDEVFEIEEKSFEDGGWRLKLTPRVRAMKRLIEAVEVSGASLPTNVVMKAGDGSTSVIRFKERQR